MSRSSILIRKPSAEALTTDTSFSSLPLAPAMQANLQQLGYLTITPIQAASLPHTLAHWRTTISSRRPRAARRRRSRCPCSARLDARRLDVQVLVLCPTRELADQVMQEIRRLVRAEDNVKVLTLCGGTPMRPQIASLEHGAHVAVGTPGRIMDHLERGTLSLDAVRTLVLDEADRMLDMGFSTISCRSRGAVRRIVRRCCSRRRIPKASRSWASSSCAIRARSSSRKRIATRRSSSALSGRRSRTVACGRAALDHYRPVSTIAFCNTKNQCRDLLDVLRAQGFEALTLHGELKQHERDQVLVQFANRSCSVLVATDVAARDGRARGTTAARLRRASPPASRARCWRARAGPLRRARRSARRR